MNFLKPEESENESGRDLFARLLSQKTKPQQTQNENNSNDKMPFSQVKSQSNPAIIHELEKILHISKPFNLDQTILPNSVSNHDIIEIFGRIGTGKSELLMHFMSRCLLPPKWRIPKKKNPNQSDQVDYIEVDLSRCSCHENNVELGKVPKVFLVQTDAKLNIARLSSLMETRVIRELVDKGFVGDKTTEILVKKFVRECLKSLVVYDCFNREQFLLAIAALETYIQSLLLSANCTQLQKTSLIPVFIDSINSNFEVFDRYENSLGLCDVDHTEKYTTQMISRLCSKYNVFVIATRSDLSIFTATGNQNVNSVGSKRWQSAVNLRIELDVKTHTLKVINSAALKDSKLMDAVESLPFSIDDSGFKMDL